ATGAATRSVDPATRGVDIPRAPAALTEPAGRPRPLLATSRRAGRRQRPREAGQPRQAARRPKPTPTLLAPPASAAGSPAVRSRAVVNRRVVGAGVAAL